MYVIFNRKLRLWQKNSTCSCEVHNIENQITTTSCTLLHCHPSQVHHTVHKLIIRVINIFYVKVCSLTLASVPIGRVTSTFNFNLASCHAKMCSAWLEVLIKLVKPIFNYLNQIQFLYIRDELNL